MFFKNIKKKKSSEETLYDDNISLKDELKTSNIEKLLKENTDVVFRKIYINGEKENPVSIIFIDGLINVKNVDDDILKPLLQEVRLGKCKSLREMIDLIEHGTLYHISQNKVDRLEDCIMNILNGSVALVFDKLQRAVTFDVKGFEKRAITEPSSENVYKGSKDSFVEDLRTNTATVRRKIRSCRLVIREISVGKQSLTKVAIVYMKGITNNNIVKELENRLEKIETDGVLTSGIIEEGIIKNKKTSFPQVIYTERPDKFCSNLMEGRAGILFDGLPISFAIPGTLESFLQAPEDYSQNYIVSSIIRLLRYLLMILTLFLPGFYVSVTTFHHEMIPTELALAITASKEGVPFPSFMEVIFMLIAFEVLIEAGLRLPRTIGQAVSIVGGIVVGQAAVDAKLVSPAVVVVIALTAISSFSMPNQDFSNALRLWRLIFVILSSIIGLFGLSIAGIILLDHLSSIEDYGVPYLSPFVGMDYEDMNDTIFRLPFAYHYKRPMELKTLNKKRR